MNYAFLAQKYLNASVTVHDRTYEGLEWHGPGQKPSPELFESFQKEEDRLVRAAGKVIEDQTSQMQEVQKQARYQAAQDAIPFQQKAQYEHERMRLASLGLLKEAIELKECLLSRQTIDLSWKEIAAADAVLAAEAQSYLDDTAKYLSWDTHKIPEEILLKREEAHRRIDANKVVHANWNQLRANEMPSREELAEAIRVGGEQLERIRKACKDVALKYPRPRKNHY